MPIMTPEEVEGLRRSETIAAAQVAARRGAGILNALARGNYPNEIPGSGFFDDDTGAWTEWFKAGDLVGVNPVRP